MSIAILRRSEVVKQIADIAEGILQDHVRGYILGEEDALMMFRTWRYINDWSNSDLINNWCEICSDIFFDDDKNKDVSDVLMAANENKVGAHIERIWMASRKEVVAPEDVVINPSDIGAI